MILPEGVDRNFLSGCFLWSVRFGGVSIILEFRKPQITSESKPYVVEINSMSGMKIKVGDYIKNRDMSDLKSCVSLIDFLIKYEVDSVSFGAEESLEIRFLSNRSITLIRDEFGFESYEIIFNTGDVLEV